MSQLVDVILQQIGNLNESDRALLEVKLQNLAEAKGQQEAEQARATASQLGIDQNSIDHAIKDLRDGS